MTNSIRNPKLLRKGNKSMILRKLYYYGAMSRLSLAKECKLTTAAVTTLTKQMIEEGYLKVLGAIHKTNRGRREVLIDINYNGFVAVGINIEGDKIHFSLCQMDAVLREEVLPTSILRENNSMDIIKENIDKIIIGYEDITLGIGIGIIGEVDEENGVVIRSYGLFEDNFTIKKRLEQIYDYPIILSNNVRAQTKALISEKDTNFVLIKHSPGVGSAIVIDEEIISGSSNRAGELGHTIVELNGRACKCGNKGCLEAYLAEDNIIARFKESMAQELDIKSIYDLYNSNIQATQILNDCIAKMAYAISNVCMIIDPQKVLVAGGMFNNENIYQSLIDKMRECGFEKEIKRVDWNINIKSIAGARLILMNYLFEV